MKPLLLTLRAFGPFAGEQAVDFTRTGTNPFLLINGPTGAGKTSLLDGLCYALYGKASGEARERQNDRFLRSQLALPSDECTVSLRFQVGERRFFIERKPTQSVLSRGKSVERQHRVELYEVDAEGAILGERLSKVGEVDARIEELVGFTCEQFRQVMVLPQGEFRRLLLAKSDDKEKILQKLFGTEKYKLAEEALKRRRSALLEMLNSLRSGMEAILSAKGAQDVNELEARLAALKIRSVEQEAALASARLVQAEAQAKAAQAQAVDKDFTERELASEALMRLEADQPRMEVQSQKAERAFKALDHVDLEATLAQGEQTSRDRASALRILAADIETFSGQRSAAQSVMEQALQEQAKAPQRAAEQERLVAQLKRLRERDAARQQVDQAKQRDNDARAQAESAAAQVADCDARMAELTREIETLSLQAGDLARLDLDISRLEGLAVQRTQLDGLLRDQIQAAHARTQAEAGVATCEAELTQGLLKRQEAQQALMEGQASRLAAALVKGVPCPVCGSADHPQPAAHVEGQPNADDLDRAETQVLTSEKALAAARSLAEVARTKFAELAGGLEQCRTSLGQETGTSATELASRLQVLAKEKLRVAGQQLRLTKCRDERQSLEASRQELRARQVAAELARTEAASALGSACGMLERFEAEMSGSGEASSEANIQARLAELARLIPSAEKAFKAAQFVLSELESTLHTRQGERTSLEQVEAAASAQLAEQRQTFDRRLLVDGFHTRQEYQEAKLPRAQAEALRTGHAKFNEALAAAKDRQARAEASCEGKTRPDMPMLVAAQQEAQALVAHHNQVLGELCTQQEGLLESLRAIGEKAERTKELEAQYRVVGRLAELASGVNPLRMTLQRYVLAALFEEVARAASERLLRMSRGRYLLVRAGVARDGRSTGGLDLDVTDAFIGETRPASTLSGGESFLAALALALGLSDVVMAQQGGRHLDSIFIDEGFGSLDGETLEYALDTLMELHSAGRLIGIISHVAELKERIDARIDVLPSKSGSTICQVNC
ncbi:MAG: SMC family ATPase [Humidesulfovibrio sp.]|uniref:AAA family ATPase n=1 Tax=Humidesulfovibrio sp. TaxID=2910988 RepID=UPI002734813E|nr:SMC family ATPase [Humidesulfovibrio sp.]MDP2847401.1 SMC family ATPase [Humidesulfovibrio sp.]